MRGVLRFDRCPFCRGLIVSRIPDSVGRIWFACGSAFRDGMCVARAEECRPGRQVARVPA